MTTNNLFLGKELEIEKAGVGITRKVTAYNKNLMCVEVHFIKGAVGPIHSHPHEQITYIVSGKFEFNIDGKKFLLESGDSTYKQPDISHGAVCLEEGMLLDIFTPYREDFLNNEKLKMECP